MSRVEPVTREPLNAHTPFDALAAPVTPADALYVRNHYPPPAIAPSEWRLRVTGAVSRETTLTLEDLARLPQREVRVVLECAGNGRTQMSPVPPGTPWGDRAVGCAVFGGVPLREALVAAGVRADALEVVFVGADRGVTKGREMAYERSVPVADALRPDTLLATTLNGAPLSADHGAPVRALVPGWYGFASVKWLVEARVVTEPFQGHYNADDYWLRQRRDGQPDAPLSRMLVKSLVTGPSPGARVRVGDPVLARGWAWSGRGEVVAVEVSGDGGATWTEAELAPPEGPHAWAAWSLPWTFHREGEHELVVRARDATGDAQPLETPWNAQGYANNAAPRVRVLASKP